MTSKSHQRASDRCAEALETIESKTGERFDVIVMVQGDEPMIHHQMIDDSLKPFIDDSKVQVVNLMSEIKSFEEFVDANCIKVVVDRNFDAMYMSRQPIPTQSHLTSGSCYKQVCVIPFRRSALVNYLKMLPTQLEIMESIDMLRLLEAGHKVRMVPTSHETHAVDTIEDLHHVSMLMRQNG